MSGSPVILAIDAGTGDCRVIAFSGDGTVLNSAKMEWTYESGVEKIPDAFAFEPEACWNSVLCLLEQVVEKLPGGEVCAITVASQRDGMEFLDREGKELYCASDMDLRGEAILSELEPFRKELLGRTGLPLHALFGLPRLLWYSRFMPRAYEKIDCVMILCDWLAFRLSGERRSERAAASSSQMLNLKTGEYDGELMELLGLRSDIFPRACSGTEVIGNLLPDAAKRIGLPSGIPVLIGGSDTHCGLVGMNCMRTGEMGVVAGTTTPVVSLLDRPMVDKAAVYTSCSAVDGQWAMEGNADSTGLSLRWVRDLFFPGQADAFETMSAEAEGVPPGCEGMSAYISVGIRGEVLYSKGAMRPNVLHLCGGQSRSALWAQILADVTGTAVPTYVNPECTALGAAVQAACGVGLYDSLGEAAETFTRKLVCYYPQKDTNYPEIYAQWLELHSHMIAFKR